LAGARFADAGPGRRRRPGLLAGLAGFGEVFAQVPGATHLVADVITQAEREQGDQAQQQSGLEHVFIRVLAESVGGLRTENLSAWFGVA